MNYEDMSDYEINKSVALCLGFSGWYSQYLDSPDRDENLFLVGSQNLREVLAKDYCNNPSDAWPIILEYGICLTSPILGSGRQLWSASWNRDGGRWSCDDIIYGDKKPLRAAMIVFLKMKDAEK